MRRGISTGLTSLLSAALLATAASAAVRAPSGAPPTSTDLETTRPSDTARRSGSVCQRWRALAKRLGETYAGHRLRHTVANRLCALSDDRADEEVWGWPWRHHDVRADLPPQRHGQFGAWEIRCGEVGPRRRCALALETVMAAGLDPESRPFRIVSHVVIDSVAGRESVLWRVHIARDAGTVEAEGGIAVQLSGREVAEPFDACGRRGCMTEAGPGVSAEVASSLWTGRTVSISLGRAGPAAQLIGILPAHGFRLGMNELIRLRRIEGRAIAGR